VSSSSIAARSSSISGCSAPASGSTSWSVSRCCSCWWFHLSASPLHSCPVVAHLRLFRSCVWLYILVRLLLLVVPSVSSSPPSAPKIFGAQDTRHMPERASLICIFPRRRAGRWSWVVVTGAGAGPAPLTGGGPKPVTTSHSVAGGRRLGRAPSVPEATATATTTVRGADRRYFREGHFLVGTPSPQASPTNYNLIYIAGSPGPLYLDGRDGGLRRVQRTSLPRR